MFYDQFSALCAEKGLSPSKAAEAIGIDKSTVTQWKKRGLTPRGKTLAAIAGYFGVSVDALLGGDATKEPPPIQAGGGNDARRQAMAMINRLTDEGAQKVLAMLLLMFPDETKSAPK